jgi:hypothetical protein
MANITLSELKQQARERADMVNSPFIEDLELTNYINNSIAELHDILVMTYGSDYYVESYSFSTSGGVENYALPGDFYKLMGVDMQIDSSRWHSLKKFQFGDRNHYQNTGWDGINSGRYRVVGSNLKLAPAPTEGIATRIWYVPKAVRLVDAEDELDGINGYSEYIIVDVAIKMKMKQEDDVSALMSVKRDLLARIERAAQDRDIANPESITDVSNENFEDYLYNWR